MTEQEKLAKVKSIVRSYGVDLRIQQKKNRKDPIPNGVSFENIKRIYIYCQNIESHAHLVCGMLIHEFGHFILDHIVGNHKHSEKEAWDVGRQMVSKCCIPKKFNKLMKHCLATYNE